MVPGNYSANYQDRQQNLISSMQESDLEGIALNAGPSLTYLTGLHFHLSERPVVALFSPRNSPVLVLPELEAGKLDRISYPIQEFTYGEKPESWGAVFNKALLAADLPGKKLGVEPRQMRFLELDFLDAGEQNIDLVSGEACLEEIRVRKDDSEIEAMQTAVNIAQDAIRAVVPLIKPGITERELAAELTIQLLHHGSDSQLPFSPIIASGPNSANPHAFPGDRRLQFGDMLIIDWGANVSGYFSDLTRTFCLGEIENVMSRIGQTVVAANQAAREIATPGIAAQELDRAARQVIRKA
jgi:Xaa-Pro dipeptidase